MSSPYVGEIRMFGGNFAPAGWMFCSGQLLPISEFETLFNLIGTTYGGDGQSTFQLSGSPGAGFPIHQGQGGGPFKTTSSAKTGGVESVTLSTQQIPPAHAFFRAAAMAGAIRMFPGGGVWAVNASVFPVFDERARYGDGAAGGTVGRRISTTRKTECRCWL